MNFKYIKNKTSVSGHILLIALAIILNPPNEMHIIKNPLKNIQAKFSKCD